MDARPIFAHVTQMTSTQRRLLKQLDDLRDGTTTCPGKLSRDCGSTLAALRPELLALAKAGRIVISQGGKPVHGGEIKGPFRVAPARKAPR